MNDLKPIQTAYKGYLFRSRLEARWAVFFDALSIEWEYEREGFDLGDEGYYLPDFYLTNHKYWVEIKPDTGVAARDEKRIIAFADKARVKDTIYVFLGSPYLGAEFLETGDVALPEYCVCTTHYRLLRSGLHWCRCPLCHRYDLFNPHWSPPHSIHCDACDAMTSTRIDDERVQFHKGDVETRCLELIYPRELFVAYRAARSARFEHGQVGSPQDWRRP